MVLIIQGQAMQPPVSVAEFIQTYPHYQAGARNLKSMTPVAVDQHEPYLFVHQMESACVSASDPSIEMLGVDDMTTCCCAIIRHTGSLATALGHFDGENTKEGLGRMLDLVVRLTSEWSQMNNINNLADLYSQFRFEVHLIGGFEDVRNISTDVAMQLLECLHESSLELHLITACICSTNTYYNQEDISHPCITGLICNVKTGHIKPASFTFQGPLEEIRRLRFATRPPIVMHSVYDPFVRVLEIKPYDWTLTDDTIQQLLGLNTNSFLHYWSTSPLNEKPTFVPACKTALKFLKDNRSSLFCLGRPYKFIRTQGQWKLVE